MWATFTNGAGWHVLYVEDGHARMVASVGQDADLALRIAFFLENEDRLYDLYERHGTIDVPLGSLP